MFLKVFLPLIALCGVLFAVYTVRASQKELPPAQPVAPAPNGAFEKQIAGAGLVEASTENIQIGTFVPGVVTNVFVKVGDSVKKGDKLFTIDQRDLQAELKVREAAVNASEQRLAKLTAGTRPEDVPPAEAKVKLAQAQLSDKQDQLALWQGMEKSRAVSTDEYNRRKFAVDIAEANVAEAQSDLVRIKAGTWQPDIEIARAEVDSAKAQVEALRIDMDLRTVTSPVDGKVLQVKIRNGEFAMNGSTQSALMVVGNVDDVNVRVDIDENDAWRLQEGAQALGSLRGNSEKKADLTFVRVEPYVIPKRSLTGESTERVDTRVLQVVYKISKHDFPIYVGQQMDVFINVP